MTDAEPRGAEQASEARSWRWWIVPGLLAASTLGLAFAVVWGTYVAEPPVKVFMFDAGPVEGMHIGEVRAFPELDLYLVGLASGEIRAVDGRIESNGCRVRWEPASEAARGVNPLAKPGAFLDPCSDSVWAVTGDHLSPSGVALRTFIETYQTLEDGRQHVMVELIGRDRPASTPAPSSPAPSSSAVGAAALSKEFVLVIEGARGGLGDRREVSSFAEIENALPFKPVLPTYLPEGLLWRSAGVLAGFEGRPPFGASFRGERVSMADPESVSLGLMQWDASEHARFFAGRPTSTPSPVTRRTVDLGRVEAASRASRAGRRARRCSISHLRRVLRASCCCTRASMGR